MKRAFLGLIIFCLLHAGKTMAQDDNRIKLFVDLPGDEISGLNAEQVKRLYDKTISIVSRDGIVDVGYSFFTVLPDISIVSDRLSSSGIQKVYIITCEFSLKVVRRNYDANAYRNMGSIYNVYNQKIIGSGSSKERAINDAIESIDIEDTTLKKFIVVSKDRIVTYFNTHCKDVLREADQAKALNDFSKAISLYFSIPQSASCYKEAMDNSIGAWNGYKNNICKKQLTLLKYNLAAVSSSVDEPSNRRFDTAIKILEKMYMTVDGCYDEANALIDKVQSKFSADLKARWEYLRKEQQHKKYTNEDRVNVMKEVGNSYMPPSSPAANIVIIK